MSSARSGTGGTGWSTVRKRCDGEDQINLGCNTNLSRSGFGQRRPAGTDHPPASMGLWCLVSPVVGIAEVPTDNPIGCLESSLVTLKFLLATILLHSGHIPTVPDCARTLGA